MKPLLLHLLDSPYHLPQTMAFAITRDHFASLSESLRALVESGDVAPIRALQNRYRHHHSRAAHAVRLRVESTRLLELCSDVAAAARGLALSVDVISTTAWLRERSSVDLLPHAWLELVSGAVTAHEVETMLAEEGDGAKFIAAARVNALAEALTSLAAPREHDTPVDASAWPEIDVGWLRSLKFRHVSKTESSRVEDPIRDIVLVPHKGELGGRELTPFDLLEVVRARVAFGGLLEMTVGPFVMSRGPGPFLPRPAIAAPFEASTWKRLPLFDVAHWNWPFCDAHSLQGDDLRLTAAHARDAEPDRAWHTHFNVRELALAEWRQVVAEHWPRCRERFVELLLHSADHDRVVVFVDNDLSHPFWPGSLWPERVVAETRM